MINNTSSEKTALITGASSGIGRELAVIFAEHGFNLVLVARTQANLEALATELRQAHGVKVTVIPADLSDPEAAKRIYDEVKKKEIIVDQLINNAGSGQRQKVSEADPKVMVDTINLNVTSITLLTRYFVADMVKRNSGKILISSSLGAFQPDPYFAVYGATKGYELLFGETLWGELRGTEVSVSIVCPGPTKTGFSANAGRNDADFAKDPRTIAMIAFKGMQKGQLVIIPTLAYKAEHLLVKLLSPKASIRLVERYQNSLKSKG